MFLKLITFSFPTRENNVVLDKKLYYIKKTKVE